MRRALARFLLLVPISVAFAETFTRSLERVATMDPAFAQSVYDSHAVQLVYETPLAVDYRARPYALVPGACELPDVSADGLVYVLRMRSAELSADDVVRSLERLRDPSLVSPNGWMLKDVASLAARDAKTVECRLKVRCHFFPWLLAMSPASVMKADGTGSGDFRLARWWKNHEMVFERRRPSPNGAVRGFDTVRYLVIDDASTQWLMFLKGELDFLGEVSRDNWDAVIGTDGQLDPRLKAAGIQLHTMPTLEALYLGINMSDLVLGPNRKLRQALNAAFDYSTWERFYAGRIVPMAGSPVPPSVGGRLDAPYRYSFNIDLARRLMSEAGYPDGIDPKTGRRLVLTLAAGRASQDSRESGELIASFYAKIGIRIEHAFYTWDAFLRATNEGRVQMFRMGWVGDYPDAQNFLQLFHSGNVRPGPNRVNYVSKAYDHAYERALAAEGVESRYAAWRECQEILREDCPWVFMHFNKANTLVRPRVGNYVPSDFPYGQEAQFTVEGKGDGKK